MDSIKKRERKDYHSHTNKQKKTCQQSLEHNKQHLTPVHVTITNPFIGSHCTIVNDFLKDLHNKRVNYKCSLMGDFSPNRITKRGYLGMTLSLETSAVSGHSPETDQD